MGYQMPWRPAYIEYEFRRDPAAPTGTMGLKRIIGGKRAGWLPVELFPTAGPWVKAQLPPEYLQTAPVTIQKTFIQPPPVMPEKPITAEIGAVPTGIDPALIGSAPSLSQSLSGLLSKTATPGTAFVPEGKEDSSIWVILASAAWLLFGG